MAGQELTKSARPELGSARIVVSGGRALASAENKPVLLEFGAEWCKVCKTLERDTFPDPGVRAEAQRFVAIRVDMGDDDDAPEAKRLRAKYALGGLPTVIIVDSAGNRWRASTSP